jgi:hypothetical protein
LMPSALRGNQAQGQWDTHGAPTGDQEHQFKAKGVRVTLAVACRTSQRMLPSPVAL